MKRVIKEIIAIVKAAPSAASAVRFAVLKATMSTQVVLQERRRLGR